MRHNYVANVVVGADDVLDPSNMASARFVAYAIPLPVRPCQRAAGIDIAEIPVPMGLGNEGIDVVDGQQVFLAARRINIEDEITLLTTAASMVDAAADELYGFLRPGVKQNECVGLVSKTLYDLGGEHVEGVNAISGERCSPHPRVFTDRLLRPGEPAFFDIVHSFNDYRTCYYRTVAVGRASVAQRDASTKCREIMDNAIDLVKPGATTADVVSVARPRSSASLTRWRHLHCSTVTGLTSPFGRSQSSRDLSPLTTPKFSKRDWSLRSKRTGHPRMVGLRRALRKSSW